MTLQLVVARDTRRDEECGDISAARVIPLPVPVQRKPQLALIEGGNQDTPTGSVNKNVETALEKILRENVEAVLRALEEAGTTNTDFLQRANIGTHTVRPKAFLGKSIVEETAINPTPGLLHEDLMRTRQGRVR